MPNWTQIVRKKLGVLEICSPEFTEELAAHLEDRYEALRCEGLSAEVALQHTIGQIEGRCRVWLVMRFLQEELMSSFITKIALPGLLTSAAAFVFYWALALDHIQPRVIWLLGGQLPLWWWCLLPICGALGALLSQRKGRSRLQGMACISASERDPVQFGAADLCRRIHDVGVREPLPVGLCPFGDSGNSAARIRVSACGLFAAGLWNRRGQHQDIPSSLA